MEAWFLYFLISVLYTRERLHAPAALYKEGAPSYLINWTKSEKTADAITRAVQPTGGDLAMLT